MQLRIVQIVACFVRRVRRIIVHHRKGVNVCVTGVRAILSGSWRSMLCFTYRFLLLLEAARSRHRIVWVHCQLDDFDPVLQMMSIVTVYFVVSVDSVYAVLSAV